MVWRIFTLITECKGLRESRLFTFLPTMVYKNGGNNDRQRDNTKPGAVVTSRLPFERDLLEQCPEEKAKGSYQRLKNNNHDNNN